MLLLRKALGLVAVVALPLLFLTVTPIDAKAERQYCAITYEGAGGYCFAWWLCEDGSGGWSLTDPSLC